MIGTAVVCVAPLVLLVLLIWRDPADLVGQHYRDHDHD